MNCFQRNRNDIQGMNEITQRLLQYLQKKQKKKNERVSDRMGVHSPLRIEGKYH